MFVLHDLAPRVFVRDKHRMGKEALRVLRQNEAQHGSRAAWVRASDFDGYLARFWYDSGKNESVLNQFAKGSGKQRYMVTIYKGGFRNTECFELTEILDTEPLSEFLSNCCQYLHGPSEEA